MASVRGDEHRGTAHPGRRRAIVALDAGELSKNILPSAPGPRLILTDSNETPLPSLIRRNIKITRRHTWCIRRPATRGDMFLNVTSDAQGMGSKGSGEYRARQRERERRRRQQLERATVQEEGPPATSQGERVSISGARRAAATACGWCGGPITPRPRGPIPKWCSATCRHRAWEQTRAAASGRAAVQVVERIVVTPAVQPQPPVPRHDDWVDLLRELSRQFDRGLVYDRGLPHIAGALDEALAAFQRRVRRR